MTDCSARLVGHNSNRNHNHNHKSNPDPDPGSAWLVSRIQKQRGKLVFRDRAWNWDGVKSKACEKRRGEIVIFSRG